MRRRVTARRGMSLPVRVLLAVLALLCCGALLFRGRGSVVPQVLPVPEPDAPLASPEPSAPLLPPAVTEIPEDPAQTEARPESSADIPQASEETLFPVTSAPPSDVLKARPIVYDARSYQLVTDMVYAYKQQVPDRKRLIAADVEALKAHDAPLGEAWGGIMEYWDYANDRMEIHTDSVAEDLPNDDSLCIVVLGFQLLPDGGMSAEMLGRCELALQAAQRYPEAFLLLTGGGTAYQNPSVTEAGVMADWFLLQGVADERLILEDRSSTTEENAKFALSILTQDYPQVKSLVIVSSDYHLPLGCLLFTEAALLYGCEYGEAPFLVVSNLGLVGYGLNEYKNPAEQALYVWALANPRPQ